MKIKLDENIPIHIAPILRQQGHDVDTVKEEGLQGVPDRHVWKKVREENRFFITQDLDFSDIRRFPPGSHSGIMLLRLDNPTLSQLIQRLRLLFSSADAERWWGCFIVVSDAKIRVIQSNG